MTIIDFKAGPQIAGTIVRDIYGGLWTVLKDIGNALAQPREGAYYTRYIEPVVEVDYKALYDKLAAQVAKLESASSTITVTVDSNLHPDDFYYKEEIINGVIVKRIRIKR